MKLFCIYEIAGHIREGVMAFLTREYKTMVIVIVVLCAAIAVFINKTTAVLYVVGALFSVLAGFFGMKVARSRSFRIRPESLRHEKCP